MTELQIRETVVAEALKYVGVREGSKEHKAIVDLYNSHKPLARGYTLKYDDEWCSGFASAIAIALGHTDIIPTEVGCEKHIELFKELDRWEEDGTKIPDLADYVFYNWNDATQPNDGRGDHVGIVVEVNSKEMRVAEGNRNNRVEIRIIPIGYGYIRGFGKPDYASKADTNISAPVVEGESASTTINSSIHIVKQGETLTAIAGVYNTTVEKLVELNDIKNKNLIITGQVIKVASEGDIVEHIVQRGDTLTALAEKYGTTIDELVKLNDIEDKNLIIIGQKLMIPANDESPEDVGIFKPFRARVTAKRGLNVRRTPMVSDGNIVTALSYGAEVEIFKVDGDWGKIEEGWICLEYTNKI